MYKRQGWRGQLPQDLENQQAPESQGKREGWGQDKVRREWAATGQHHKLKGKTVLQILEEPEWRLYEMN